MPSRELDALLLRNADRTDAITAAFEKELAKRYRAAYDSIEKEIAKLYAKIGDPPTLREARRFGRLTALQKAIAAEYKAMTREAIIGTRNNSASVFANGAYGTQWAYDQNVGVAIQWPVLSVEAIRQSVWDGATGENFSQRLREWNTKELIALNQKITSGLAQGFGFAKMAQSVKQEVNDDYSRIIRIVRTEAHRNYSQGHLNTYENLEKVGIEARKQWVSTLDTRTRDAHGNLDGTFADDSGNFSSNAGGYGPAPGLLGNASDDINCRCRIIEVIDGLSPELRRIRGEDIVPYTTFSDWASQRGWSQTRGWDIEKKAILAEKQAEKY
jgi:SPP1 gp7 family putative phage head morphogenesis protein